MARTGTCVIRPVHVALMVKRYRILRGIQLYQKKHAYPAEQIVQLDAACEAILRTLGHYQVDLAKVGLRPIRYQPPEPLTQMQLVRALLSAMRISGSPLHIDTIVSTVIASVELPNTSEINDRLQQRVSRSLKMLGKRGIVRQTALDIWTINC